MCKALPVVKINAHFLVRRLYLSLLWPFDCPQELAIANKCEIHLLLVKMASGPLQPGGSFFFFFVVV